MKNNKEVKAIIDMALVVSHIFKNSGLHFKECEAAARACIFMMEEIDRTDNNFDEEKLIESTIEFIRNL